MAEIYVLLENIRSAYNVGAMFRTSDGAGVKKIFLCGITATPPNAEISKTALGAEDFVKWEYEEEAVEVIEKLKKKGVVVVAVEIAKGAKNYWEWKVPNGELLIKKSKGKSEVKKVADIGEIGDVCLIFGHEVQGVSKEVLDASDDKIFIPMFGKKESLNVEAAFSTVVYEIKRKLKYENQK